MRNVSGLGRIPRDRVRSSSILGAEVGPIEFELDARYCHIVGSSCGYGDRSTRDRGAGGGSSQGNRRGDDIGKRQSPARFIGAYVRSGPLRHELILVVLAVAKAYPGIDGGA